MVARMHHLVYLQRMPVKAHQGKATPKYQLLSKKKRHLIDPKRPIWLLQFIKDRSMNAVPVQNFCVTVLKYKQIYLEVIVECWCINCCQHFTHPTWTLEYSDGNWQPGTNALGFILSRGMVSFKRKASARR